MNDYRARLRDQLRAAADDHLKARETPLAAEDRRSPLSPRRRRHLVVGGLLAAALVTPAALAASGVIGGEIEKGEFGDGSTFNVVTVPDPREEASARAAPGTAVCERVEFRDAEGKLTAASTGCGSPPATRRSSSRLAVGLQAAPAGTVLLRGTAPDTTASIEVADAIGPVHFDKANLRFVAQVPRHAAIRVIARSADGRSLDSFEQPAMEP